MIYRQCGLFPTRMVKDKRQMLQYEAHWTLSKIAERYPYAAFLCGLQYVRII